MVDWGKEYVSPYAKITLNSGSLATPYCVQDFQTVNMTTTNSGTQSIVTRGPVDTGFWIDWGDGSETEWVQHTGTGNSITTTHTYAAAGTKYQKWIGSLTNITYMDISTQSYSFDASALSKLTSLTTLYCQASPGLTGDVSSWSALTSLTSLYCYGCTGLTGDVSSWSALTSLMYLYCYGCTGLTGDVSSWSALTSLTTLSCYGCTGLTGDVSSWSALTSLTQLNSYSCTGLTGDVSSWSALTSLTFLNCRSCTSLTGDVSSWSALTLLTTLYAYGTSVTYTTTVLPAWNGSLIRFDDCAWTTPMVDAYILNEDTSGATGGSINIAGTNAAHTTGGAVDTAIAALAGKSRPVTVN